MLLIVKPTVAWHMSLQNQPKDNKFLETILWKRAKALHQQQQVLCVKLPFHLMHTINNPEGLVSEHLFMASKI
jgi:hypothetical protein